MTCSSTAGAASSCAPRQRAPARARFRALFLTHLHSDHTTDLNDVITSRWITSFQPSPLAVFGPTGTAALVRSTEAMLEHDIGYRLAHHADLEWRPSTAVTECERGGVLAEGTVRVSAAPTDHAPVRPTVGFRVDDGGMSVVLAGDTIRARVWTSCAPARTCWCTPWCAATSSSPSGWPG